jgi:hypothetical protein
MSKTIGYSNAPADIAEKLENSMAIKAFLPSPASIGNSIKGKKDSRERFKKAMTKARAEFQKSGLKRQDLIAELTEVRKKIKK